MTGQELWASLLQEAIQGRLVEQRDDEPPVEQMGNAPEDVPFAIPEKWKWSKLGDVLLGIQAGKSYKCDEVPPADDQCGLVKVSAVTWGEFDENESKTCFSNENWVDAYAIHKGDFLISRANTAELVGSCVVVNRIHKRLMLSDKILRLKFSDRVYQSYVLYLLRSPFIRSQFVENATGTSNSMKNISQTVIRALTIPLPPLAEQRRIVARLEELRPLVDDYGAAAAELTSMEAEFPDKLRASLLQGAISGRLVEQRDDEPAVEQMGGAPEDVPFAIPEKWKWVRLGACVECNPKIAAAPETEVSFVPMADVAAGHMGGMAPAQTKNWAQAKSGFSRFADGDVILAKITPCFQNRKSAICTGLTNGLGFGSTEFQVLRSGRKIDKGYLLAFVKSAYFIAYGVENFKGTAGQKRLGTREMLNCPVPLPPLAEQHRIVARLEELLPEVARLVG